MKINKAIWKTGALAAVITLAAGLAVIRLGDWSKGLSPASFDVTKVIPQIAVGSFDGNSTKYSTVIEIVNTSATPVSVRGHFYKAADGTASDLTFTTNRTAVPAITNGVLAPASLPANSSLVISAGTTADNTPAAYATNWAKIQATGSITIATFFEVRDGVTDALRSRIGVAASVENMMKFVIPRVRNVDTGFDLAVAIVNTGTTPATVTATLRDASGVLLAPPKAITLGAGVQSAKFIAALLGLTNEPSGTSYSFITFESASAQFAAIALAYEGATGQTSFPVEQLQ
jgi:hypothetical protein